MYKNRISSDVLAAIFLIICLTGRLYSQDNQLSLDTIKRYDFKIMMRDGVLIDCAKFIPADNKPVKGWPIVVFCHGFSDSKEIEAPDARDQAEFGYYTFVYSMRGQGFSGGLSNLISTVEMNDLFEVINYIKQDPAVDSSRIAVFGASQGGIIPFMAACNGIKVTTVMSDLASPEFASSWIENGCIKVTFLFSIDYDSSLVRYTNEVKNLRRWVLSKETDKWDSLGYFVPKKRDFLDKVHLCKIPVLITNAWQDRFFNATGMIKASKLLKVPFMAYFGAVDGHGADTSYMENNYITDYDNKWERYWLNNMLKGYLKTPKYQYASSHFPKVRNNWSFTHFESKVWPPEGLEPLRLYFNSGGKLSKNTGNISQDTVGFWNDLIDTSFTMQQAINTSFRGDFFNKRFSKNSIIFESDPLTHDYQMIGVPKVKLFYSSNADVCQYNVQLWEVKPGADTCFVTRVNYTDRHYEPGVIKEQLVEGAAYSHIFQQGDKIRVVITNLDTQPADSFLTTNPYVLPVLKKSYNTVLIGDLFPSYIEMPVIGSTSGIAVERNIKKRFTLFQNYPNPVNKTTDIKFRLEKAAHVEMKVYDKNEREVAILMHGRRSAGTHNIKFNNLRTKLSRGEYYIEMKVGNVVKRIGMDID
jgi:predicted acyl esterase